MYEQVFFLHAQLLKALAHPRRLEIVHLLRTKTMAVCQIQEMLDLPQANISQHLQILRKAGVVETKRDGKNIYYKLSHLNFIKASDLMRAVLVERNNGEDIAGELTKTMLDLVPVVTDPVCKMRVSPATAGFAYKHKDKTYYFCASGCLKEFKKNIKQYAKT
jgi:DNA-binding transcriptional ArsR family regulator/YHS domain-containing protein